jgi:hypothetical protein
VQCHVDLLNAIEGGALAHEYAAVAQRLEHRVQLDQLCVDRSEQRLVLRSAQQA